MYYLYYKNILEYTEIALTDGNPRILYIEGHSIVHSYYLQPWHLNIDFLGVQILIVKVNFYYLVGHYPTRNKK